MEIIKFLQSFSSPVLDVFFTLATILGEDIFYTLVLCIIFWCINKKLGYRLGFSLFLSISFNSAVKEIINSPRPIGIEGIVSKRVETATGMSFPSGHTQGVTTFWGSFCLFFKKRWLYILSTFIIVLVGISRLYLGVHWPVDVVGGIIFGILCVILGDYLVKNEKYKTMTVIVLIMVLSLFFLNSSNYVKSVSMFSGFMLGLILEKKYINFSVNASLPVQFLKLLIGIAGILAFKEGLKLILPSGSISEFVRYFTISFWAIAIYPFLFNKVLKKNY